MCVCVCACVCVSSLLVQEYATRMYYITTVTEWAWQEKVYSKDYGRNKKEGVIIHQRLPLSGTKGNASAYIEKSLRAPLCILPPATWELSGKITASTRYLARSFYEAITLAL